MFVTTAGGLAFGSLVRYSNNFLVANKLYDTILQKLLLILLLQPTNSVVT